MRLSIAEGYYLIALDDEEGRILAAAEKKVTPGIVGAGLLELLIQKKISISNKVISIINTSGTGNIILDNILKKIVSGRSLIDNLKLITAQYKEILGDLNLLLAQRGILTKEETKLLWIPLSERMDNANYAFEQEIRNNLKAIVFKNAKPTPAFMVLFTLINASNILNEVFRDNDELEDAKHTSKEIILRSGVNENLSHSVLLVERFLRNIK